MHRMNKLAYYFSLFPLSFTLSSWAQEALDLTLISDNPPLHSIVFSVDAFHKKQQFNQTQTSSEPTCYIHIKEGDSEDLYQKAFESPFCVLVLSGEYTIDKSLPSFIKMVAANPPTYDTTDIQNAFTSIKLESISSSNPEKKLLVRSQQDTEDGSSYMKPSAVLVKKVDSNGTSVTLPDSVYGSGIGIRTDNNDLHITGCLNLGIVHSLSGDEYLLWFASEVSKLCTLGHYSLFSGYQYKEPRQYPKQKPKQKPKNKGGAKGGASGGARGGASGKGKPQREYEPTAGVRSWSTSSSASGAGGAGGGDKNEDDEYRKHLANIKRLYLIARTRAAMGQDKRALANAWKDTPVRFKNAITKQLDMDYPGDINFSMTLKKCPRPN